LAADFHTIRVNDNPLKINALLQNFSIVKTHLLRLSLLNTGLGSKSKPLTGTIL
jgi:hypothetical protein